MEASTELTPDQNSRIEELDRLKESGVIDQAEYDDAAEKIRAGEPDPHTSDPSSPDTHSDTSTESGEKAPDDEFLQSQAAAAAAQSPAEPQVVPEVRPQAAVSPAPGAGVSEASKRIDAPGAVPMGPEAYEKASSEDQMKAAAESSRMPNLVDGTRVVITGDHPEAGRMAYILSTHYTDGIQDMIASSGTPEARFADVDHYVLRTRDGRSDLLTATPDQVKPLDTIQGWGRGQI